MDTDTINMSRGKLNYPPLTDSLPLLKLFLVMNKQNH